MVPVWYFILGYIPSISMRECPSVLQDFKFCMQNIDSVMVETTGVFVRN